MDEQISQILARFEKLENLMSEPEVISDHKHLQELAREHGQLAPVVETWHKLSKTRKDLVENSQIVETESDAELV